jgi:hypothetical protein
MVGVMQDPDYNGLGDPDLVIEWKCINMNDGSACLDAVGLPLAINTTELVNSFQAKSLTAYSTYSFFLSGTKDTRSLVTSAIIIVIEMDLPLLTTEVPSGFIGRRITLNEQLNVDVKPDASQNPDDLRYAIVIIYDFENVAVF